MLSIQGRKKVYRYLRCGCCDWRICDAPVKAELEIYPYYEEQNVKDTHLVLKCKRCKSKNIVIIK